MNLTVHQPYLFQYPIMSQSGDAFAQSRRKNHICKASARHSSADRLNLQTVLYISDFVFDLICRYTRKHTAILAWTGGQRIFFKNIYICSGKNRFYGTFQPFPENLYDAKINADTIPISHDDISKRRVIPDKTAQNIPHQ